MTQTSQPRYQRIKDYILAGIRDQIFLPGNKIPPELELAKQFGVSRMTVNKAIRDLAEMGILLRFAGDGTYVAESKAESPLLQMNNIADEIHARGHNYSAEVLDLRPTSATEDIALCLGVKVGSSVYYSLILHQEDGLAVQLEERYVNPVWAEGYLEEDFHHHTPNEYLMRTSPLTDIEHVVEAVLPNRTEQQLLEIGPYEPCILVQRRTWSHKNLVSYARLVHPGGRYTLHSQTRVTK